MKKSDQSRTELAKSDQVNHLMDAPTYRLAALDEDFLMSASMRGVRFMLEFYKTEEVLRARGINSTLVVFGSARMKADTPGAHSRWYNEARLFGRIASERGGALGEGKLENVIATGGGPGLMEAANRGARDAGAPTIGFNIELPHEQAPNPYISPDLVFRFHYFAMRKMHLVMRANALIAFPGGFGTLDELFEIMTLKQTGKGRAIPIVLFDEAYWRSIINFDVMVEQGVIEARDLDLIQFADRAEDVWSKIVEGGIFAPTEPRP